MKRFVLIAIAFCFIFAANSDAFSQTRKVTKKRTKTKLVKCYEKGKIVYRKKCRFINTETTKIKKAEVEKPTIPNGNITNGNGTGGGLGNGRGQGQGNGDGAGLGYGRGDGVGNGSGDGLGSGSGDTNTNKKEKTLPNVPTTGIKILSKPRPLYTETARENKVTGKVLLRVTFSANGTIGGISVISGLGNGLTEQAIMAARKITFEPATRGGVAITVTKPIEYTFIPE